MYLLPLLWVAGVMAEEVDPFEKPDCDPEMLKEFEETLPSETVIEHYLFCDPSLFSYIYIYLQSYCVVPTIQLFMHTLNTLKYRDRFTSSALATVANPASKVFGVDALYPPS